MAHSEQPSSSAEEGVVRYDNVDREATLRYQIDSPFESQVAVGDGTFGVAQIDKLVHPESLHPDWIEARLMAEAVSGDLEEVSAEGMTSRAQ